MEVNNVVIRISIFIQCEFQISIEKTQIDKANIHVTIARDSLRKFKKCLTVWGLRKFQEVFDFQYKIQFLY